MPRMSFDLLFSRSVLKLHDRKYARDPCAERKSKKGGEVVEKLFHKVSPKGTSIASKVTVVGTGQVGMAAVFAMLTQGVTKSIAMVDRQTDRNLGEQLDLLHGSPFLKNANVEASTDYSISSGSKLCIVSAGARQKVGESRLNLVQRNADILKDVIPQLVKHSPDTVLLIATNPVDIITYVSWKLSKLPYARVIGSGTNLDSSRFRFMLSQKLGVAPTSCHAYIIGEHGDSSVPVWSGVNIAGVRLSDLKPNIGSPKDDVEGWSKLHDEVVQSAYKVIKLKGYTSWAIGLSLSQLASAILHNEQSVHPVSIYLKGQYGIKTDVCLSVPCVLGDNGIVNMVRQRLTDLEIKKLHKSASIMDKVQKGLKY